jgi:hypothetical protein
MLSNLNNRVWITDSSGRRQASTKGSTSHRLASHGAETNGSTVVRIQKDVEYKTDDQDPEIPMDSLAFGRRKQDDIESGDKHPDYVVTTQNTKGASYVEF